jgi:hypothetical protein
LSSRLFGGALSASALALFAVTFAPWFAHEELDGPDGDRLRESESLILALSGWELEGRISALILLAVFLGIGAGLWSIRRPRDPLARVACALAAAGGLAAAWVIGAELGSPSDSIYNDPRLWIKVALAAALATAATGLLAGLAALGRREQSRPERAPWPVIGGSVALYLLALGANELEVWQPQFLLACCVAGALGYLVPRWWLALLPIVVVVLALSLTPDACDSSSECESLRGVLYAIVALGVSAALGIGIGSRLLRRRALPQQQV